MSKITYNYELFRFNFQIFSAGFSHKEVPTSIDLNAVRLCFQAFLGGAQKGKYSILEPVVSDPIYDKSKFLDLVAYIQVKYEAFA